MKLTRKKALYSIEQLCKDPTSYCETIPLSSLKKMVEHMSHIYYNTGEQLVTDSVYDKVYDILKKRDPEYKSIGSKISHDDKRKVELPYYVGSMNKIKDTDSYKFDKWISCYNSGKYVISDKLDGSSGLLKYSNNNLKIYTRGDGYVGQDVSYLQKYINFPSITDDILVRGEFVISIDNFDRYFKDKFKKARNLASGMINSKTVDKNMIDKLDFVAHELIYPRLKYEDQYGYLKKHGFKVVWHTYYDHNITITELQKELQFRRKESTYKIDGLIVASNDKAYEIPDDSNPKYAFAFKMMDEEEDTTITKVHWEISKTGLLKPTIYFNKIVLDGSDVQKCTGHNAKYIYDNGIGPGAKVSVILSNEVIPKISNIYDKVVPQMPDCEYTWRTDAEIEATDTTGMQLKQLVFFFNKIGVKDISIGILTKLMDIGMDTVGKILFADIPDFMEADGIRDKMATKLFNNIHTTMRKVTKAKLMSASCCFPPGLGERIIQSILDEYPGDITYDELLTVEGIHITNAEKYISGYPLYQQFLETLPAQYRDPPINYVEPEFQDNCEVTGPLVGHRIVFTGFRDTDLERLIKLKGGAISDSLSKKCSILLTKDPDSGTTKIEKAKKYGITIMGPKEFKNKYLV